MLSTERWLALPAQKALGYSVNTTDDAELEEIKEKLIEAKDGLLGYDDTTFYEKLISGEAVMTEAWDGWCGYGMAENPDIKFVVPEEGSDLWVDTMVVLKDSENKEAAHRVHQHDARARDARLGRPRTSTTTCPTRRPCELVAGRAEGAVPAAGRHPRRAGRGRGSRSTSVRTRPKYTELTTEVTAS